MKHWSLRLLSLGALLVASQAVAVPAPPHPIALRNADGTTVMGRLFGDEHLSWAHDVDGYPLAYDKADGAWHYATLGKDGRLSPLPYRAGNIDPKTLTLTKGLVPTLEAKTRALETRRRMQPAPQPQRVPLRGTVGNLTLLVKFNCSAAAGGCSSVNRNTTYTPAQFVPVLNGATNSAKAFYSEVSYGALQLTSTIANNAWIQLDHNDDYYAYNDNAQYGHPEEMIIEAVQKLDAQGFDFSRYDADNDGIIDAIHVIHVGPGYETSGDSSCIHSHYADLRWYGKSFSVDGVRIVAYHTEPELREGNAITQIGVIVHESGHFFGLPDLYDYSSRSAGLGMWSLMAAGAWGGPGYPGDGTVPVHPDAWSKVQFGFVVPRVIGASTNGVRLRPSYNTTDMVKVSAGMPSGQFFLIENRKETAYDTYIPASGLAIYHVDENRWSDTCSDYNCNNNDPTHYLVDLEQPDGQRELNNSNYEMGDSGDVWPYSSKKAITPTSTPNTLAYGQSSSAGKISINNITKQSNGDITFDIAISGTQPTLKPNGQTCSTPSECQSGFCADGVCCNAACNGGECDACSTGAGATVNGTCAVLTGTCDDGNACTRTDTCVAGICVGGNPVVCDSSNCSTGGTCNSSTGRCSGAAKPNGTTCDDGNPCTQASACSDGVCEGTSNVTCPAPAPCHLPGACDTNTGSCVYQPSAEGASCSDGNLCTVEAYCTGGQCLASRSVMCQSSGECHDPGVCDPSTGTCSDPASPDGTVCREVGVCTNGYCGPKQTASESKSGCGCASSGSGPASALFALLLGLGLLRRRAAA